jgi:hypothetical protein
VTTLTRNPAIVAAVITGVATTVGAIAAGIISSRSSEEQLEGNLIVEAVKFLVKAGFLPNHAARLEQAFAANLEKVIPSNCPPASR